LIRKEQRAAFVIVCAVALGSIAGGAGAIHAQTAVASEPMFTARWLSSCEAGAQRTYFSVEVFEEGRVRYTGSMQARERGEKTLQLSRREVERLASAAADFTRGRSSPVHEPKIGSPPDACVEVASGTGARQRVRRESVETRTGAALTNEIASVTPIRSWACPGVRC
jgi:hypothetical protein